MASAGNSSHGLISVNHIRDFVLQSLFFVSYYELQEYRNVRARYQGYHLQDEHDYCSEPSRTFTDHALVVVLVVVVVVVVAVVVLVVVVLVVLVCCCCCFSCCRRRCCCCCCC